MSSSVLASPPRRHHLSPKKPMKPSRLTANSSSRNNSTFSTSTKRTHSDENSNTLMPVSLGHKRVKSGLSRAPNAVPKPTVSSSAAAPALKTKRAFGFDVTNIRASTRHSSNLKDKSIPGKSTFGKPIRTIVKPHSPKRHSPKLSTPTSPQGCTGRTRAPPSPRSGSRRVIKRAFNPSLFKRIDPPSFGSGEISSIDSLLASASRPTPKISIIPASDVSHQEAAAPLPATKLPDSWFFDIYEDTLEETMQNLMEHSTCILDISDDSGNESSTSELQEKGKENICPSRLAELLAVNPEDRGNAMRVDVPEKHIPQRRSPGGGPRGRVLKEHRQALRALKKEELVVLEPMEEKKADGNRSVKLSTLDCDNFVEHTPPKRKHDENEGMSTTPKSPGSPGFIVWESDHEKDAEDSARELDDEIEVAAAIPLPRSELDFDDFDDLESELGDQKFQIFGSDDAASLGEVSDKEN